MREDQLAFLREIYEPWSRGDFSGTDWAHPDLEFAAADGPAPGVWRGLEATSDAWGEVLSAWTGLRAHPEEFRELEDGRILVLTRNSGRGKTSGLELGEMGTRGANVLTIEGGRVTKLVAYFSRDRALADLGLS